MGILPSPKGHHIHACHCYYTHLWTIDIEGLSGKRGCDLIARKVKKVFPLVIKVVRLNFNS